MTRQELYNDLKADTATNPLRPLRPAQEGSLTWIETSSGKD